MLVKELRAILENLDDNTEVVIRSRAMSWDCYERVEKVENKTLNQNGKCLQEESYQGEPVYPVRVVVIK